MKIKNNNQEVVLHKSSEDYQFVIDLLSNGEEGNLELYLPLIEKRLLALLDDRQGEVKEFKTRLKIIEVNNSVFSINLNIPVHLRVFFLYGVYNIINNAICSKSQIILEFTVSELKYLLDGIMPTKK